MPCPGLVGSLCLLMGWWTLLLAFLPVAHHTLLCVLAQSWPNMVAVCLSQGGTGFLSSLDIFLYCLWLVLCMVFVTLKTDPPVSVLTVPLLFSQFSEWGGFCLPTPNEPIFLSTFPPFLWTVLWLLSILLIFPTLLNINFFDFSHKHPIFSLHVLF